MADSVITLKDQKFRKVKGVWVDQKKTPAPKDLIGLLDKLSDAEAAVAGPESAKEDKPALPVLPIAAKDFSTAKLESSINRLAKIIENLSKTIEKGTKSSTGANSKDAPSAQRVYEPGKIPTLREAMKLNVQEFFKGATNKYGEKQSPGLLRNLTQAIFPVTTPIFAARDRRRNAIGNELREYESTLSSNPNLSKKEIDQKIAEKRKELENPKTAPVKAEATASRVTKETAKEVARMKAENPELTSAKALEQIRARSTKTEEVNTKNTSNTNKIPTFAARDRQRAAMAEQIKENDTPGEKEREKTNRKSESEFASPELDKKIIAVKITEIDDSVLKKLSEIFGKKDDKASSEDKEEDKPKTADNKGGGLRDKIKKIRDMFKRKSPKGAAAEVEKEAEQLLDKNGKPLRGAAKASREAKLAKEAAESAEQVAKKPGILSRILGGGAKTAGVEGAEKLAIKAGGSLLSKGLRGIPVLGAIAGAGLSGYETYKESGSVGKALFSGGGSLLGGLGGEAAGSIAGPVGTVAGGIAGSIGGGKLGEGVYDKLFGKPKPQPAMIKPAGVTPQTQVLTATTKRVEAAKEQKATAAPTVINNNVSSPMNISSSQGVIGGPTVADRGSLNLASF